MPSMGFGETKQLTVTAGQTIGDDQLGLLAVLTVRALCERELLLPEHARQRLKGERAARVAREAFDVSQRGELLVRRNVCRVRAGH
jgi:hypothetical protein